MGGYSPPPPLKTRFFEGSASLDHVVADSREKVRFFPQRMVRIGRKTHFFFETRRQQGLERRYLPEKLFKKGGTPILGTFWQFWGFPVKTVCQIGIPEDASQ